MIEAIEQLPEIVRARARLGVSLEAEHRALLEGEPLERAIEERAVRGDDALGERLLIHREAVVLTRDEHTAGFQLLHRMVRAMVAEFHLHGARAGGEAEDLMAETDAEHREVSLQEALRGLDGIRAGLGISGAVREEDAVGLECERFLGRGLCR